MRRLWRQMTKAKGAVHLHEDSIFQHEQGAGVKLIWETRHPTFSNPLAPKIGEGHQSSGWWNTPGSRIPSLSGSKRICGPAKF